jgi:hypothetical protein
MAVMVPMEVPETTTDTPGMVDPSSELVTVPETYLPWAFKACNPVRIKASNKSPIFLIDLFLNVTTSILRRPKISKI